MICASECRVLVPLIFPFLSFIIIIIIILLLRN